jgi:hypothetical protein
MSSYYSFCFRRFKGFAVVCLTLSLPIEAAAVVDTIPPTVSILSPVDGTVWAAPSPTPAPTPNPNPAPNPNLSALANVADSLSADSWGVLTIPESCNSINTLLESSATGNITSDASQGAYDPVKQQIHFIGKGAQAGSAIRHVVYDLATNTCTVRPTPSWSDSGANRGQAYEFGPTIDARGRILYRGHPNTLAIERYNLDSQTWLSPVTPGTGVTANTSGFHANAFHYERGAAGQLILVGLESSGSGVLYTYDPTSNSFARLNGGAVLSGFNDYSVAEYSEIHKVTLFGGRNGTYRQVDTRGTITTISTSGMGCQPYTNRDGILHADPVTGNFVLLCGASGSSWHIYNPITNTWTTKTAPGSLTNHILKVTPAPGSGQTWGVIGVPISDHGVILYVACDAGSACQMRLYKGGKFTAADRDFKRNCYKANVVYCAGFDSPNDIAGTTDIFSPYQKVQPGNSTPTLDSSAKLGNSSLKFTVPPNSGANAGGEVVIAFRDDGSLTFGKDDEFYIQWRQRFSPCLLYMGNNDAECTANGLIDNWANRRIYAINGTGNEGGWKLLNFNEGGRADHTAVPSHGDIAFVTQDSGQKGMPQYYSYGQYGTIEEGDLRYDGNYQTQWNNGEDGINCIYPGPYTEPGCARFRPDQWMTIQLHFKPNGVWNVPGASTFEMWFAQDGLPPRRTMRRDPAVGTGQSMGNADPARSRFGQFRMTNYHTEKNPTQTNPVAYTWFDNVIISKTRISDPGIRAAP